MLLYPFPHWDLIGKEARKNKKSAITCNYILHIGFIVSGKLDTPPYMAQSYMVQLVMFTVVDLNQIQYIIHHDILHPLLLTPAPVQLRMCGCVRAARPPFISISFFFRIIALFCTKRTVLY